MFSSTRAVLAALLILATASACATTSGSTGSSTAPGADGAQVTTTESRTEVVCEFVRPSGSNIMVEECREVRRSNDGSGTRGAENWFKGPAPSPSR